MCCVPQVNIGIRVLTKPLASKLPEIYRTLGTDYAERVLPSIIQVGVICRAMGPRTWVLNATLWVRQRLHDGTRMPCTPPCTPHHRRR
jgi:hypothetical protein